MYTNANPIIRNFWKNLRSKDSEWHLFKHNKNMVFFGDTLSEESFDFVFSKMKDKNIDFSMEDASNAFFNLLNLERGHTVKLTELAIQAVSEAFDVPADILNAQLNEQSEIDVNRSGEVFDYSYEDCDQDLKDQINKRILLNCLIQGSSIHSFYTLHHIVKNDIDVINNDLIGLYDIFALNSVASYYFVDYSSLVSGGAGAIGSAKVEFDDEDNPKVIANAKSFPVLCQELVKGSLETICLHSLKDLSEEDLKKIYHFADDIKNEPRYIQIGSQVWREILELKKLIKTDIPNLVMKINLLSVNEIENFFEKLLDKEYDDALFYLD